MPLVAVLLALVAVAFFVLPLVGLFRSVRRGATLWDDLQRPRGTRRAAPLARVLALGDRVLGACSACRSRACSRGREFPGASLVRALVVLPMVLPPVVGGVALLSRVPAQQRARRWTDLRPLRLPVHVLEVGRRARRDVRRHAVPGDHGRGRAAHDGPSLRGRGRQPRRRTVDGVPAGHAADDRARADRRCRAGVGARARGVRRDDHVRRQHPGPHPDDAARGLQPARVEPGRRDRAQPGAARRLGRRAGRRCATAGSGRSR